MKACKGMTKAAVFGALGDHRELRKLLRMDADLASDPQLLCGAALQGNVAAAALLLEAGADPDGLVASHENYRPLHRAIEHRGVARNDGHMQVAGMLLDAGASLEKRATWMQLVPLAVAGMAGDAEMIDLLVKRGAEVNVFTAASIADTKKMRGFLKRKSAATSRDINNMTVLHYAALCGLDGEAAEQSQRQIAEILMDAGADGDARENIGPYPPTPVLHFAAWKNYALAKVLLSRGCDPNHGFGNCLWREPGRMAELFLSHGADVNGHDASGQPFLNRCIHWNLTSVALWLLKNGADPNSTDKQGNTPLHEAAIRGVSPMVVQAILASGGLKKTKNKAGQTCLDIAKMKKRDKIILILR